MTRAVTAAGFGADVHLVRRLRSCIKGAITASIQSSSVARLVVGASALTTLGTIPVFLLGAQAVFIRSDLGFGATEFGAAVSVFFASAAAAALLGGGVLDRIGRRKSTLLAGALAATGGFGTAGLAQSWLVLVAFMAVLGATNAACQVTSNLTLARAVPPHRRGLGFGVKQAAIPLAIALAGLAVPAVAQSVGWRWTYVCTGAAGLVVIGTGLRMPRAAHRPAGTLAGPDRPPLLPLLIIATAVTVASAAANSFGAFVASWAFEVGLTPSEAGVLMASGSALNLVVRVWSGHRADQRHGRNLPVVAVQMLGGGVALALLSIASPWAVVPAALAAFVVGWSWPGLLMFAVVRVGRELPGLASGFLQAGAFLGAALGPGVFGVLVGSLGYPVAWGIGALLFFAAAVLVLLGRRLLLQDLVARPPTTPLGYGGGRGRPLRTTEPPRRADDEEEDTGDGPPRRD
jgi:MFS family permease